MTAVLHDDRPLHDRIVGQRPREVDRTAGGLVAAGAAPGAPKQKPNALAARDAATGAGQILDDALPGRWRDKTETAEVVVEARGGGTDLGTRPALAADEIAGLRRRLLAKGRELAEQLAALMAGLTPKATDLLDARPGETPIEKTRRYLDLIDQKIKAILAGTYGRCERCSAPIAYAQLAELPWMDVCRACTAPA